MALYDKKVWRIDVRINHTHDGTEGSLHTMKQSLQMPMGFPKRTANLLIEFILARIQKFFWVSNILIVSAKCVGTVLIYWHYSSNLQQISLNIVYYLI